MDRVTLFATDLTNFLIRLSPWTCAGECVWLEEQRVQSRLQQGSGEPCHHQLCSHSMVSVIHSARTGGVRRVPCVLYRGRLCSYLELVQKHLSQPVRRLQDAVSRDPERLLSTAWGPLDVRTIPGAKAKLPWAIGPGLRLPVGQCEPVCFLTEPFAVSGAAPGLPPRRSGAARRRARAASPRTRLRIAMLAPARFGRSLALLY